MFATPSGREQALEWGMGGVSRPSTDQTSTRVGDQTTVRQQDDGRAALYQSGQWVTTEDEEVASFFMNEGGAGIAPLQAVSNVPGADDTVVASQQHS